MKRLAISVCLLLALSGLRSVSAAVVAVDFSSFPVSSSTAPEPIELNGFATLGTNGELFLESFSNPGTGAFAGAGPSNSALIFFDTSQVTVHAVEFAGDAFGAPVIATAFDAGGVEVDQEASDIAFTLPIEVMASGGIASIEVRLLEAEVLSMNIDFTPIPLPAPVLLLLSGVIAVAGWRWRRA